jgi:hypothetical protein
LCEEIKVWHRYPTVLRSIVQVENGLLDYCWNWHVDKKVAIYLALEEVSKSQ